MSKMYYPVFHYEGKKPILNALVEQKFAKVYNRYCEMSKPLIEGWNNKFDEENPDLEEDRWDPESKYMTFFREQENRIIREIENDLDYATCLIFRRFYCGEECEFRGVLYDGTEMYFTLREGEL